MSGGLIASIARESSLIATNRRVDARKKAVQKLTASLKQYYPPAGFAACGGTARASDVRAFATVAHAEAIATSPP
jgi:hypothetical protein